MNKIIENRIVKCDIGSVVTLESGRTERLLPSDWDRCEFRFPNPIQGWEIKHAIAINVKITGRTFQWMGSEYWVKVQIEWVGDGEPSTFCDGWLLANPHDCERAA